LRRLKNNRTFSKLWSWFWKELEKCNLSRFSQALRKR